MAQEQLSLGNHVLLDDQVDVLHQLLLIGFADGNGLVAILNPDDD
jgi:hypothetical protein